MKILTWSNETRVKFRKKDPDHACVSITFPGYPDQYLYVDKSGDVHWYNEREKTSDLVASFGDE